MGILSKLVMPHGEVVARVQQLVRLGMSNEEIARILERDIGHIAKERSRFNATQPVGERFRSKGYKYGLPLLGAGLILPDHLEET